MTNYMIVAERLPWEQGPFFPQLLGTSACHPGDLCTTPGPCSDHVCLTTYHILFKSSKKPTNFILYFLSIERNYIHKSTNSFTVICEEYYISERTNYIYH